MTKDQVQAFGNQKLANAYLVPQPLPADSTINGHPTPSGTSGNPTAPPQTNGDSGSEQPNITGGPASTPNSISEQSNIIGTPA